MNFRHIIHAFHAIFFSKVKSPFFSNLEDLCALCPVESVYGTLQLYLCRPLAFPYSKCMHAKRKVAYELSKLLSPKQLYGCQPESSQSCQSLRPKSCSQKWSIMTTFWQLVDNLAFCVHEKSDYEDLHFFFAKMSFSYSRYSGLGDRNLISITITPVAWQPWGIKIPKGFVLDLSSVWTWLCRSALNKNVPQMSRGIISTQLSSISGGFRALPGQW